MLIGSLTSAESSASSEYPSKPISVDKVHNVSGNPRKSTKLTPATAVDNDGSVRIPFERIWKGMRLRDWLTMDREAVLALSNAMAVANAGDDYDINDDMDQRYQRSNNAVLRDWPAEGIHKNSRYRLTDAYGHKWNGPLRTMGVLRAYKHPRLVGYAVSKVPLSEIPELDRSLMLPTGNPSNMLNKTYQDFLAVYSIQPVWSSYQVGLDVSVSTMIESEGRYLRNAITLDEFSFDALPLARAANAEAGDYLSAAIDKQNELYHDGVIEYVYANAPAFVHPSEAYKLLPYVESAYNAAGIGNRYMYLSAKALPDPIRVGNEGDARGNMVNVSDDIPEVSTHEGVLAAAVSGSGWKHLIPTKDPQPGQVGVPTKGWATQPAADGGMTWNFEHLQASPWLDGRTVNLDGTYNYYNGYRVCWLPKQFKELFEGLTRAKLTDEIRESMSIRRGEVVLKGASHATQDWCFIPVNDITGGYGKYIHQNGSVINLLVDAYDPKYDEYQ